MERHAFDVDVLAQDVPGGALNTGDDGAFASAQGSQQAGASSIGPTCNHNTNANAHQRALAGFAEHGGKAFFNQLQPPGHMTSAEEVYLHFRKINGSFYVDAQPNQRFNQFMNPRGK